MGAPMSFENLFSIGASIRVAFGIIFALFIVCFVAIIIEETFLGGRRRRKAQKIASERGMNLTHTEAQRHEENHD